MALIKLIPKVFYADIHIGLKFFAEGMDFAVTYQDAGLSILHRDGVTIQLVEDEALAKTDRPEIRIVTDDIEAFYQEISTKSPQLLHPNLNQIKQQPWGLKEFALLDQTNVCIIIQQG